MLNLLCLAQSEMDYSSFVRVIAFWCIWLFILEVPVNYVAAEPTITTRILRGEQNTLTLECETKINPHRNILQLKNGELLTVVNSSGALIFPQTDIADVKVTGSSGLRQINTEVTKWNEDTTLTCSTLISVGNGSYLTNYTSPVPKINQTEVETPKNPTVELSPSYVVFSENALFHASVEFMCVSNFVSEDTETFRWSLTSTSTGKEFLDDDLIGIADTGVFIKVDSSPTVSSFQINGLDFPTVPDDFVVQCSVRLNADESYVTASATVQIANQSALLRKRRIIIFLACATCVLFVLLVAAIIVSYVMKKNIWKPDNHAVPRRSSLSVSGLRQRVRKKRTSPNNLNETAPRQSVIECQHTGTNYDDPPADPPFYQNVGYIE